MSVRAVVVPHKFPRLCFPPSTHTATFRITPATAKILQRFVARGQVVKARYASEGVLVAVFDNSYVAKSLLTSNGKLALRYYNILSEAEVLDVENSENMRCYLSDRIDATEGFIHELLQLARTGNVMPRRHVLSGASYTFLQAVRAQSQALLISKDSDVDSRMSALLTTFCGALQSPERQVSAALRAIPHGKTLAKLFCKAHRLYEDRKIAIDSFEKLSPKMHALLRYEGLVLRENLVLLLLGFHRRSAGL